MTKKIERCPCGSLAVCVQCHQIVEGTTDVELMKHRCPENKRNETEGALEDKVTMALMKKLGKKCPNCDMFIIKNAGCDVMMCGDDAHGDLQAIKAGGATRLSTGPPSRKSKTRSRTFKASGCIAIRRSSTGSRLRKSGWSGASRPRRTRRKLRS